MIRKNLSTEGTLLSAPNPQRESRSWVSLYATVCSRFKKVDAPASPVYYPLRLPARVINLAAFRFNFLCFGQYLPWLISTHSSHVYSDSGHRTHDESQSSRLGWRQFSYKRVFHFSDPSLRSSIWPQRRILTTPLIEARLKGISAALVNIPPLCHGTWDIPSESFHLFFRKGDGDSAGCVHSFPPMSRFRCSPWLQMAWHAEGDWISCRCMCPSDVRSW